MTTMKFKKKKAVLQQNQELFMPSLAAIVAHPAYLVSASTGILLSPKNVITTVWMHHLDSNKTPGEKDSWKLHKNAVCCFDQILETATYKTAAVYHSSHKPSLKDKQDMLGTVKEVRTNL